MSSQPAQSQREVSNEQQQQQQLPVTSDAAPSSTADAPATQKLEGEALKEAIVKQVEYWLSRANLATDSYLVSQMNSELFVPISVLSGMNKMKALTTDVDLIMAALKQSQQLVVDEAQRLVRPNFKLQRNTLILRDIPSDTPLEEVKAIFDNEHCGKIVNIRSDIGDTWFVVFEDEESTVRTFEYLQTQKFKGKPIRVRIKSENLLRSSPAPSPPFFQPVGGAGGDFHGGGGYGFGPGMGYFGNQRGFYPGRNFDPNVPFDAAAAAAVPVTAEGGGSAGGGGGGSYARGGDSRGGNRPGSGGGYRTGGGSRGGRRNDSGPSNRSVNSAGAHAAAGSAGGGAAAGATSVPANGSQNSTGSAAGGGSGASEEGRRRGKPMRKPRLTGQAGGSGAAQNPPEKKAQAVPQLGLSNFPPLPSKRGPTTAEPAPAPVRAAYTREQIVAVLKASSLDAAARPEGLPADCVAVLAAPNTQLELEMPIPPRAADTTMAEKISNARRQKAEQEEKNRAAAAATASAGAPAPAAPAKEPHAKGAKHGGKDDKQQQKGRKNAAEQQKGPHPHSHHPQPHSPQGEQAKPATATVAATDRPAPQQPPLEQPSPAPQPSPSPVASPPQPQQVPGPQATAPAPAESGSSEKKDDGGKPEPTPVVNRSGPSRSWSSVVTAKPSSSSSSSPSVNEKRS